MLGLNNEVYFGPQLGKENHLYHEFAIPTAEKHSATMNVAVRQFYLLSECFQKFPRSLGDNGVLVNLRNESHHVSSEKSFIRVDPVMLWGTRKRNIVETQGNLSYPTFK